MILDSWPALLFLAVAFAAYRLAPRSWRVGILAAASLGAYIFLAGKSSAWMILLAAATFAGVRTARSEKKDLFWFAVAIALALLILFKYVTPSLTPADRSLMPLGLSYLCFQSILSLVEARRGKIGKVGAAQFASYFFFFSTTASGPIKSLARFLGQEKNGDSSSPGPQASSPLPDFGAGTARILLGLAKKIVIASSLQPLTAGFANAGAKPFELWIALYAYAFYIYFDFSGYTDMAVGIARLFGYHIEENFDWPYLKTNIRDFWRSWHMSLTRFMRDVVYIPLGGNRAGLARHYGNLLAVFVLIGLWHGGRLHLLLWGMWHGLGMIAYQIFRKWRGVPNKPQAPSTSLRAGSSLLSWFLTFNFVAFGWVLFACDTASALRVFLGLFGVSR